MNNNTLITITPFPQNDEIEDINNNSYNNNNDSLSNENYFIKYNSISKQICKSYTKHSLSLIEEQFDNGECLSRKNMLSLFFIFKNNNVEDNNNNAFINEIKDAFKAKYWISNANYFYICGDIVNEFHVFVKELLNEKKFQENGNVLAVEISFYKEYEYMVIEGKNKVDDDNEHYEGFNCVNGYSESFVEDLKKKVEYIMSYRNSFGFSI